MSTNTVLKPTPQHPLLIDIERPEWLRDGLEAAIKTFHLGAKGHIPESIEGWMIVTSCMRVLRAIYGSDLATACAIREIVINKETQWLELAADGEAKEGQA